MNVDKYKLSFLVDTGITSLWVCVCVCWEMWHIRKVVLLLRSFTHTRSHTHILNPEFTYTNTHSCTKWGWICGYYGNHVKVAGEFNSTVETGRERERSMEGKKCSSPETLCFSTWVPNSRIENEKAKQQTVTKAAINKSNLQGWCGREKKEL